MGTGNPNPRKLQREQEALDRREEEARELARKVTLNENFYGNTALRNFIVAARELNKDTKRREPKGTSVQPHRLSLSARELTFNLGRAGREED